MPVTHTDPPVATIDHADPPRRQRADAERNRLAVVDAAIEVFGERGLDATVSEIAQRAGVGQGTVFRHFPTKEHLIAATVLGMLDRITATATQLLDESDPLLALRELMHAGSALMVSNHGFKDATANSPVLEDPQVQAGHQKLLDVTDLLLTRAKDARAIRPDITPEDISLLLCAISATDVPRLHEQPALWERYFELIFSGLCVPTPQPLAVSAPTPDELRQLKTHPK
jgi:AcrR family transcriptional regulator